MPFCCQHLKQRSLAGLGRTNKHNELALQHNDFVYQTLQSFDQLCNSISKAD